MEEDIKNNKKKMQNLVSIVILFGGLFIGSLFVDAGQIIKGSGYSQKNLNQADIFEANGKTWVAYNEPAISIKAINDDTCETCNPSEILVWLRRVLPTISVEKIESNSEQGKKMISEFEIKTLPTFIFEKKIENSDLYTQANSLFKVKNDSYILNSQVLGLPIGKYLEFPKINEGDAVAGKNDSKVTAIIYSDFQCPYCKLFYASLRSNMKNYQDKVKFAFKELPLSDIHPQAISAALSAECALEQNKFWEYADILYSKQAQWANTKDTSSFKLYAKNLKLNSPQFDKCLDDKKYQTKIDTDIQEAENFGITGTPTVFIGDKVESGVLNSDKLKELIEKELKK